jgi:hypothetical protein
VGRVLFAGEVTGEGEARGVAAGRFAAASNGRARRTHG